MVRSESSKEKCECCGHEKIVPGNSYFICDECNRERQTEDEWYLDIAIFYNNDMDDPNHVQNMHFCSWACLFVALKKLQAKKKDISFVSLPTFNYAEDIDELKSADTFFEKVNPDLKS